MAPTFDPDDGPFDGPECSPEEKEPPLAAYMRRRLAFMVEEAPGQSDHEFLERVRAMVKKFQVMDEAEPWMDEAPK